MLCQIKLIKTCVGMKARFYNNIPFHEVTLKINRQNWKKRTSVRKFRARNILHVDIVFFLLTTKRGAKLASK